MAPPILTTVLAQPTAVETLERALAAGRVHHAYLFDGPDGVGKELTAFGLAQALVCERRGDGRSPALPEPGRNLGTSARACGECRACLRAAPRAGETRPLHPDVVVLERGLYDPAAIGRRSPETQDISIDQVRALVLARAAFPPLEGRAKVFIVRRADELSVAAANALLKTLEEPGPRTHFVLLSSVADALLPTILSRTQRVRFGLLPDDVVAQLLSARGVANGLAIARLAAGSMSAALRLSDPEASAQREAAVERALLALRAPDLGPALELAEDAKKADRAALYVVIEAIAQALADQARAAVGRQDVDADADIAARRHALALAALRNLDGNASPQLTVESMLIRMRSI
jgi:DNA polymerase-3 subunit delta'